MRAAGLVAAIVSCAIAHAQTPSAAEIVEKMAATYATTGQYHFVLEGEIRVTAPDGKIADENHFSVDIAMRSPDHGRVEASFPGMDTGPVLVVVNGDDYWAYMPRTNQYLTHKSSPIQTEVGDQDVNESNFGAATMQMGQKSLLGFQMMARGADSASFVRLEAVKVDGVAIDCSVIEMKDSPRKGSKITVWIDQKRYIVLRHEQENSGGRSGKELATLTFKLATINEPLPDSLFVFSPPAGAERVMSLADFREP
jgi:outer membrane lipoprotein-sorting protein